MNYQKVGFRLILSLLMAAPSAWAGTVVTGEVDAGYQKRDVSANEATFDQYGKTPEGVDIPYISVNVASDSNTVHFEGQNVQQNNQSYELDYNHSYQTKINASWDQTPHDYSNVGETLYTQTAPGVLSLPSQIQSNLPATKSGSSSSYSPTNSQVTTFNNQFANYMTAAHNANLQTLDNKGAVNMDFRPAEHVKANFGFSEDRVEGNKPLGASFGFNQAVQVPEPIDWRTYNLKAGTQYDTKDVQMGINYRMSSFNNDNESLKWSNPARLTDSGAASAGGIAGPVQGQMSVAPDNWSHTVTMNGGANLPANTRFTATGTMAYMHQNENLMSWTSNSAIVYKNSAGTVISQPALPEATANANIMTWTQDYAVSNRVLKPLTLGLKYHSYQMINRTDEVAFAGRAIMDSSWEAQADGYNNDRYEFRKDILTGSADYAVFQPLSLGFKYNVEWDHNTNRLVTDSTENGYAGTVDYTPARWTTVRGSYVRSHRVPHSFDYSLYLAPGTTNYSELPGLQQFDLGDRVRNQGKIIWQVNPVSAVTIGLNGSLTHDNYQSGNQDLTGATGASGANYPATLYGLQDSRDSAAGADIGWNASDRLAFDVYYDYEETQGLLRSNEGSGSLITQAGTTDWDVRMLDKYQLAGVHATLGGSADRVTTRLGYDVTMSRGSDNYVNIGSGVSASAVYANGLPQPVTTGNLISPSDTKYMKQDISIRTTIKMTDHTSLVLGYLFEKFDVSDWQTQNIPLVGGTGATQYNNYLGTNLQNYVAHVGTILVKYKF